MTTLHEREACSRVCILQVPRTARPADGDRHGVPTRPPHPAGASSPPARTGRASLTWTRAPRVSSVSACLEILQSRSTPQLGCATPCERAHCPMWRTAVGRIPSAVCRSTPRAFLWCALAGGVCRGRAQNMGACVQQAADAGREVRVQRVPPRHAAARQALRFPRGQRPTVGRHLRLPALLHGFHDAVRRAVA